ncbi:MAG TPA: class I adenylate-forming enzyme family protein [Actinomycetaceae bacterium]|nr:class I adenylate-forming enzyme family protein [Actinomycetaceae bacterium]
MLLRDMLFQAAERFPDREAVVDGDRRVTYDELWREVRRLAAWLSKRGFRTGDRLAIGMCNSLDHVKVLMACQTLGVGAVPFNIRLKPGGIVHILRDCGARGVVVDHSVDLGALRGHAEAPQDIVWVDAAADARAAQDGVLGYHDHRAAEPLTDLPKLSRDTISAIIYTSGTTGRPKGVHLTQRNAYSRLVTYVMSVGPTFDSGARTLGAAPLYHTVGMHWVFLQTLFVNGTYYPVAKVSEETTRLIDTEGITFIFGSPTLLKMIMGSGGYRTFPSVRHISYGSAPAEPELLESMYLQFPNASISEVYGTTELSIPFVTPDMRGLKPGTLRRTGDFRVRVVQPGGEPDDVVRPGELGELIVHLANPGVFSGYWGPEGEARLAEKRVGEWFRTGDGFRYDAESSFYFDGRLDDMFVSGGENIQPAEVENTINGMEGVVDCAVIAVPDPLWSNVVTAFIVTDGRNLDAAAVDAHCRASDLEDYKRPRKVFFVPEIPRNPSGKIVRSEVRKRFADLLAAATGHRDESRVEVSSPAAAVAEAAR